MFLILIMASLCVFIAITISSVISVNDHEPFENTKIYVKSPVDLAKGGIMVAAGTFDRRIQCTLLKFDVFLKNQETGKTVVLGIKDLVKAPPINIEAGKNIPVSMTLRLTQDIFVGWWVPVFQGEYECNSGLAHKHKIQRLIVPAFEVIDSSN